MKWVKADDKTQPPPLYRFLFVRDNVGCKRLGNFFCIEEEPIMFSVCGTEMYESFEIPNKDLWSIEWLDESTEK